MRLFSAWYKKMPCASDKWLSSLIRQNRLVRKAVSRGTERALLRSSSQAEWTRGAGLAPWRCGNISGLQKLPTPCREEQQSRPLLSQAAGSTEGRVWTARCLPHPTRDRRPLFLSKPITASSVPWRATASACFPSSPLGPAAEPSLQVTRPPARLASSQRLLLAPRFVSFLNDQNQIQALRDLITKSIK